jgi:drug/metabolite transporter (DMT)-like permease
MKKRYKAYLFALLATLCWSTIASAFKLTLEYIQLEEILLYSSFVSTSVLWILLVVKGKVVLLYRITWKDTFYAAVRGLLNPFLYYFVLLQAYNLLKAQEAGTLNYIWPITLVLLSIPMLKQRIGFLSILAILISFTGILVISTEGNPLSLEFREPKGVALALISSIFWALYWILNLKDKKEEILKLFLNFGFGTLFIFAYVLFFHGFSLPTKEGLLGSVYIGIFEMSLTYFLWLLALKHADNTARVSNLVYLSPFISLILISALVNEEILGATVVGLMLIVAGILLQHFTGRSDPGIDHDKSPSSTSSNL